MFYSRIQKTSDFLGEGREMDLINRQRVLKEFFELVRIDSPTKEERRLADVLKVRLEELNFEVTEDSAGEALKSDTGNLFAYRKGIVPGAPVILLVAHMDTVEPGRNIEPALRNGLIISVGNTILGADDKSGIVPILEAIRVINEQNIPHGDIQILFCVAEEGGVNGSRNLDQRLLRADLGFVLDSGGAPGTIILEAPGQERIDVTIQGKAAHAGVAPESGISAILVASRAIASMRLGRIDEETTANIGSINGGHATNIIADRVEITGEARSRNLIKLEEQTSHMVQAFEDAAREMGAQTSIQINKTYKPYKISSDSQVASIAAQAAKSIGLNPIFGSTGGGSDANHINQYRLPCAVLGIGMQKSHTTEECILEEDLYKTSEWVIEIIQQVGSVSK